MTDAWWCWLCGKSIRAQSPPREFGEDGLPYYLICRDCAGSFHATYRRIRPASDPGLSEYLQEVRSGIEQLEDEFGGIH